eukprot:TRINITY_DN8612_c0_g5_i1.p1 TRINITY_DN8612_c0_g5~~TRINITY_DN8612_c0_g5_i1.p1  ORF type:complete len:429 (-),score=63.90 TRINITY_DN8612_c0_g5_i1:358-1485(-)
MPLELDIELNTSIVVLELHGGDYCALHIGHTKSAEDFTLYMRLLTGIHRQQAPARPKAAEKDDDARSECSVQTGIVQQQLNSTPMAAVASADPKEAKRMFKMFTETMRRGRDFYVVRADGALYDVECSLSRGHDEFRMRWDGQTRVIPLKDILNILTPIEVGKLGLKFALDERCSTMELQTGECITFKFGHTEACERFVLCMRILLEQKRPRFVTRGFDGCTTAANQASGAEMFETGSTSARRGPGQREGSKAKVEEDPKEVVEMFVRQMVAGVNLEIMGPSGPQQVRCSMQPDLRDLLLTASDNSCRSVSLADVKAVLLSDEASKLGLPGITLDELCATVELKSGDCATFRFQDVEQRERFVLCIRIFASAHQQ